MPARTSRHWHIALVYGAGLAIHAINSLYLLTRFKPDVMVEPEVKWFYNRMLRFLTVWNVISQMIYLTLGLSCEIIEQAVESKVSWLLNILSRIRDLLFSCIVWPHTWLVFTVFWPLFLYDRSLVLPQVIDVVLTRTSNHVIHTAIVPIVLLGAVLKPRPEPNSHFFNLCVLLGCTLCYLIVIVCTYLEDGRWIYPIMTMITGTMYLYLFIGGATIAVLLFYYAQWPLYRLVGGGNEMKKD